MRFQKAIGVEYDTVVKTVSQPGREQGGRQAGGRSLLVVW